MTREYLIVKYTHFLVGVSIGILPIICLDASQYKNLFLLMAPYNFLSAIYYSSAFKNCLTENNKQWVAAPISKNIKHITLMLGIIYTIALYSLNDLTRIYYAVGIILLIFAPIHAYLGGLNVVLFDCIEKIKVKQSFLPIIFVIILVMNSLAVINKSINHDVAILIYIITPIAYSYLMKKLIFDKLVSIKNRTKDIKFNYGIIIRPEVLFSYLLMPSFINIGESFFQRIKLVQSVYKAVVGILPIHLDTFILKKQSSYLISILASSVVIWYLFISLYFNYILSRTEILLGICIVLGLILNRISDIFNKLIVEYFLVATYILFATGLYVI